jgi:hypothetical protein
VDGSIWENFGARLHNDDYIFEELAEKLRGTVHDTYLSTVKSKAKDAAVLGKDVAGQFV